MKLSKLIFSLVLTSTIAFNANAGVVSSSLGATTIVLVADYIINKNSNIQAPDEVKEAVALSALSSIGAAAGLTLLTTNALNFLSSNQRTEGLSSLMEELRKDEKLKDKSDEELAYLIIEAND